MPLPDIIADDIDLDNESDESDDDQSDQTTLLLTRTDFTALAVDVNLKEHIGEFVRVDLRPRERATDGTVRRLNMDDLDPLRDIRLLHELKEMGTELYGTLQATGLELNVPPPLSPYPVEVEALLSTDEIVHINPLREEDEAGHGWIHPGEQGFSRVKDDEGIYHLVETADINLQ